MIHCNISEGQSDPSNIIASRTLDIDVGVNEFGKIYIQCSYISFKN